MLRIFLTMGLFCLIATSTVQAQIGIPTIQPTGSRTSSLQDVLVNNLRATLPEQKEFLRRVQLEVTRGTIDRKLVLAVMRYAQRRHSTFPFPFFERAMRFQASKQGVDLPNMFQILSTRSPTSR